MTSPINQPLHENVLAYDGNWIYRGYADMVVQLDPSPYYRKDDTGDTGDDELSSTKSAMTGIESLQQKEWNQFQKNQQNADGMLREDLEFVTLIPDNHQQHDEKCDMAQRLQQLRVEVLEPRRIHIASCVLRRVAEGIIPSKLRIKKLSDDQFQNLLRSKQEGNEFFQQQKWEEAILKYQEALSPDDVLRGLFVAPSEQIQQIVTVLSNMAECCLRRKDYHGAGRYATDALTFDNNHEKSRMRRAKSELAIAGPSYLIQAEYDLNEIIDNNKTTTGVKEATKLIQQLQDILEMERITMTKKQEHQEDKISVVDWDDYKRYVVSTCW